MNKRLKLTYTSIQLPRFACWTPCTSAMLNCTSERIYFYLTKHIVTSVTAINKLKFFMQNTKINKLYTYRHWCHFCLFQINTFITTAFIGFVWLYIWMKLEVLAAFSTKASSLLWRE